MALTDAELDRLGFSRPLEVAGRVSIADLFPQRRRTGIYALAFENGDLYAGKSVDVTRRYQQHLKVHTDVVSLRFLRVPRRSLDEAERDIIYSLERARLPLRNIQLLAEPKVESDFDDEAMTPDRQEHFRSDTTWNDGSGTRTQAPELRARYGRQFQGFMRLPEAPEVIRFLRLYVPRCIPAWVRSELSFWSLSCWPGRKSVLARLNLNWQEVLTLFVPDDDDQLWASFHVTLSTLQTAYGEGLEGLVKRFPDMSVTDHFYVPGGQDQCNVFLPLSEAGSLLADATFLNAARSLNLRLMRKGPCVYARHHCFDLADVVVAQ